MFSYPQNLAISLTEEQGMLLDVARGFVRDQAPIEVVRAHLETETGYESGIWQSMIEMGWTGLSLPDAVGGAGMGVGSAVPVFEALGNLSASPKSKFSGSLVLTQAEPFHIYSRPSSVCLKSGIPYFLFSSCTGSEESQSLYPAALSALVSCWTICTSEGSSPYFAIKSLRERF